MSPISPLLVATVLAFFFFFFTLLPAPISAFNRYTIGGKKGWNPGVNYTLWNNHTRYYVGDWLVFLYQPNMADVIQVNKTDYEACSAEHPITNYSKGRSYAFRLNHTGDFYFICSKGYCYQGMKVHFLAEVPPPPSPPPSSSLNLSGARSIVDSLGRNAVQVFGAAAAVAAALLRSI